MPTDEGLRGLGGWLILVGIGVVVAPIRILATTGQTILPLLDEGVWQSLTTPGSVAYHPLWAPIIIGEIAFNSAMVCATLYLAYLFFTKSYRFPGTYIALTIASAIFVPLDAWIVTFVLPDEPFDEGTTREFARVFVGAIIWIPYMIWSKRVQATFVEGRPRSIAARPA